MLLSFYQFSASFEKCDWSSLSRPQSKLIFSIKDRWLINLWGRGFQIMNEDARSEAENWWKINFAENDLAP